MRPLFWMTAVPPCWVCPPAAVPFSTSGRIYEYTRSYIRGDRVRLDVHMQKSGMNFVRTID